MKIYWEIKSVGLVLLLGGFSGCASSTGRAVTSTVLGGGVNAAVSKGDPLSTAAGAITGFAQNKITEKGMEQELSDEAQDIRDKAKADMVKQTSEMVQRIHRAQDKTENQDQQQYRRVQYVIPAQNNNPNVKQVPHEVAVVVEEPK
ncbi:MAG: hypothetical protein V4507_10825 [Verrucomicrobiota bacterium]